MLIGMMGSGKTTVGRRLAAELGRPLVDSDAQVEARTGRTVREIFESDGEAAYRVLEREALVDALAEAEPSVVAAAGGVVLDPGNRAVLQEAGTVVWLRARPEVLARRVSAGRDHRPLLGDDPLAALRRLDAERRPLYAEVADLVVDVDDLSTRQVVTAVLELVDR
ncbi:MAG: Shikimate kinase I [uncultured Acidimicrobiales bacterium]|uniref:Shikimate kinase n=1 Tax=uncultured Acidimicrobiales bacterium TaxID=310071 RepID=A0A6J4HUI3_9ACTN|nr:MAG: Shikimate kinase I [uncultured Acidimicrobiales bacterium]